jgi:hypothetical protein
VEFIIEITPQSAGNTDEAAAVLSALGEKGFVAYAIRNDYDPMSYISGLHEAPKRCHQVPARQQDYVFSRIDAVAL